MWATHELLVLEIKLLRFIILLGICVIGIAFSVYGTVAKNRWGVNLNPLICPTCGAIPTPGIRRKSFQQFMWGGRTCEICGTEMDKWGRIIERRVPHR